MNDTRLVQRLKNPSLTLYAFHLRHSLTQKPQQVVNNAAQLWENLAGLGKFPLFQELRSLREQLICYQNGKYNPSGETGQRSDCLELIQPDGYLFQPAYIGVPNLNGLLYALRLNDTYAADLTLSAKDIIIEVAQLSQFNPQGCLLPNHIQASLGQTLLLYAEPVDGLADAQTLAEACIDALLQESGQLRTGKLASGKFFGKPIFEYDGIGNDLREPARQCHILVWLNDTPQILDLANKAYHPVLNLLCCRHKILYTYHQFCQCNDAARQLYNELEQQVQNFQQLITDPFQQLQQLKNLLIQIPHQAFEYACYLRDLEDDRTTIATNAKNYSTLLAKISHLAPPADKTPDFFQNFLNHTRDQLQLQTQIDLSYLTPGKDLFQQLIGTIRGVVEIEQARVDRQLQETLRANEAAEKERDRQNQEVLRANEEAEKERDRRLQNTIQVLGFGLAAAGIASSISVYLIPQTPQIPIQLPFTSANLHPFAQSLLLSLCFGVAGAAIAQSFIALWRLRSGETKGQRK